MTMTGTSGQDGSARKRRMNSAPSRSGILKSVITRSGGSGPASSSAPAGRPNVLTATPSPDAPARRAADAVVGEPGEEAARMAGGVAADGARHLLAVDRQRCRLAQEVDGAPVAQRGAMAEGAVALVVGEEGELVRGAEIGEARLDQLDGGMQRVDGRPPPL